MRTPRRMGLDGLRVKVAMVSAAAGKRAVTFATAITAANQAPRHISESSFSGGKPMMFYMQASCGIRSRAQTERCCDSSKRSAMVSSPESDQNVCAAVLASRAAAPLSPPADYCGGTFTHAATSGLLAGTGLRQVADRSVGMTAALR